ncbi:MAG: winged helix-turn-helix domain-containing protein [Nitrospiria bacterium]
MRLLLLERDQVYGIRLRENLQSQGYIVDWLPQEATLSDVTDYDHFEALIFSHDKSGKCGGMCVKIVREGGHTIPILVLSRNAGIKEEIRLLDAGADDFLLKPVHPEVVYARLRAILRRKTGRPDNTPMVYGNIRLDFHTQSAFYRDEPIPLNRKEYLLLRKLLENKGRVQPRENLEQLLYGWEADIESNTLEVYIYRLRKKFSSTLIQTVRGVGYVIRDAA